jgi:hypothetical protein
VGRATLGQKKITNNFLHPMPCSMRVVSRCVREEMGSKIFFELQIEPGSACGCGLGWLGVICDEIKKIHRGILSKNKKKAQPCVMLQMSTHIYCHVRPY